VDHTLDKHRLTDIVKRVRTVVIEPPQHSDLLLLDNVLLDNFSTKTKCSFIGPRKATINHFEQRPCGGAMSSAGDSTPRRQMSFHFINSPPSLKTERSQRLHCIRSHAGRWTQQRIKQHSRESETDIYESHAQDINLCSDRASWNSIEAEAAGPTSSSASLPSRSQTLDWATSKTTPGSHNGNGPALNRANKPLGRSASSPSESLYLIDYIGAGTLDPFHTYPSRFPPRFINSCIMYS
jgi:hypothetical protein